MINPNNIKMDKHGPCTILTYKDLKVMQLYGIEKPFSVLAKYKEFSMIIELGLWRAN